MSISGYTATSSDITVSKDDLENVGLAVGITSISLFYGKLLLLPV